MASPRNDLPSPVSHGYVPPSRDLVVSFTRSGLKGNLHCWSKLPHDLLLLVFERLGFADFERAKCVCSSWQSASRQSKPNNQIPWMIIFPKGKNYCLLFNPEEKDKVYKTQDLGNDFGKSFCLATYRSWLLMQPKKDSMVDNQYNLYISNILTLEKINLPCFEAEYGLHSSILWIDEKTKDYLVIGMVDEEDVIVIALKKGDNSWNQIPQLSGIEDCFNMIYKDHKLYYLSYKLNIFDFSRETPLKIFKISVRGCVRKVVVPRIRVPGIIQYEPFFARDKNNVVVTVGGDILIVTSLRSSRTNIWNFKIYKMNSSNGKKFFLWEMKQFFWI